MIGASHHMQKCEEDNVTPWLRCKCELGMICSHCTELQVGWSTSMQETRVPRCEISADPTYFNVFRKGLHITLWQ